LSNTTKNLIETDEEEEVKPMTYKDTS